MKWRKNYHFSAIIISNSQIETLVSYSMSTNVHENMSFPSSNFAGNFSTYVFGKSFWHFRELKMDCWTSRSILCEKLLNTFVCVEVRILVEKWNVYEGRIFSQAINTNMQIGKDFFVFKYPVTWKQKISKFWLFLLKIM